MEPTGSSRKGTRFSLVPTFDSLPSLPNNGAFSAVAGWNSANSIDHAGKGLMNVSEKAMNNLTNGNAALGAAKALRLIPLRAVYGQSGYR
ncbi:hypothetical protein BT96DRAFT_997155 [Gymnopus androsaceus JB14]|uniref:Uncharacterized protein n=1 Tax=Gymnopus androsaceus JB14 TaxID=1447944 RepID=A0A6A4HCD7_9AGAR|nr:hypothetical protein BT96DRAFT_997155 [Gymnopus androsaceus JB14]